MVTKIDKIKINEEDIVVNPQVENNKEMKGYRNIALFGVDSRKGKLGKGSRSDTVMIASINQDTGDVKLVSVYRDTYLISERTATIKRMRHMRRAVRSRRSTC